MIVWLTELFREQLSWLNLFSYQTVRIVMAALTALFLSFLFGPWFIRKLQIKQIGQQVRSFGPQSHLSKQGTPTMGGVMILAIIIASTLLWSRLDNAYIWLCVFVLFSFGVVGWVDDYRKLILKDSAGLASRWKYLLQSILALMAVLYLYFFGDDSIRQQLVIPFFSEINYSLGWLVVPLGYLVLVGSSNAVNLTDGLDGLAIMPTVLVGSALGVFTYVAGHTGFADYLLIPYVAGSGELAVFCAAIAGSGLGFLWFNTYPAQVFMGDVGALALGASLGLVAFIIRQELILFIIGGIFVLETVSVILQVGSFKMTGKRIFRMAPLHHHFEEKGWSEPKVIVRFWIVSIICVLVGLLTLKVR